ncbi:MAG: metal-dependent transcriptional regulator [Ruminococcaceae bacterium]|nr:metal-dependent transcriptional regulator [Oscillospiraceae bacterium]
MKLQESGEMYLETILILSQQGGSVRSIDVADYMGYSKPSVSRAVGILRKGGLLTVDKNGYLNLTEEGSRRANKIYERHKLITEYLMYLGVDEKTANDDACKIEHVISDESFDAIKEHVKKFKDN